MIQFPVSPHDDEIDVVIGRVSQDRVRSKSVRHHALDAVDALVDRAIGDVIDRLPTDRFEILEGDSGGDRGGVDHVEDVQRRALIAREFDRFVDRAFRALVAIGRSSTFSYMSSPHADDSNNILSSSPTIIKNTAFGRRG